MLIVDDTVTLRTIVQVYLMGWGLEFKQASNGREGLEVARAMRPHLVITDIRMPEMDGFELCAAIRSDPALTRTPVVILTTQGDQASRETGKLVGATAFMTKPVSVDGLREIVRDVLRLPVK